MKLKELHSLMQDMQVFTQPKIDLEQYPTGPHIASRMLYTIESMFNDFEGRVVLDLGCGTGMLAVGAALLGSPAVMGVDIDLDALEVAQVNMDMFEGTLPLDLLQCDVRSLLVGSQPQLSADTVVMNPPFGTRRKGADVEFLRAAVALSSCSVYSLHKSSTRAHIHKVATSELGCQVSEVLAELRYDLPATYKFHRQASKDIEVDLWRFVVPEKQQQRQAGRRQDSAHGAEEGGDEGSNSSDDDSDS